MMHSASFGVIDYVIFALTLSFSTAIGLYFGCFGAKQKSATTYLYGNGNAKAIPVGLSLYSSAISAITIIGTPAEVYVFGIQFILVGLGALLSLIITWNFILPIFCGSLKIKTPYEYFELRYDKKVRIMSSIIYIVHTLLYMPVVLYASTLAFSEITAIPLPICTTIVGGICVFYTMLGGFSSVIWTDTLQATLMLGSCLFVLFAGINKVGNFTDVWFRAEEGGRTKLFNLDPNPLQRLSFWSLALGMCFNFASHSGCAASTIQRYMSLPNEKQARISTFIGASGLVVISVITGFIGLCMYAFYHNCDPVTSGEIKSTNRLVPLYIEEILGGIPGFTGFFIAGLLSAGLSTLSAELNTVSGLIYHDFIQNVFKYEFSETKGVFIMKLIVFINGAYYLLTAPMFQYLEYLFQCSLIIGGLTYGAKLGVMLLAAAFPQSNSQGVIWGTIASLLFTTWISIGQFFNDVGKSAALPVSISNCNQTAFNFTNNELLNTNPFLIESEMKSSSQDIFFLYRISFMYNPLLGTLVTITVGMLISYLTRSKKMKMPDANLLIPYFRTRIYQVESVNLQNKLNEIQP